MQNKGNNSTPTTTRYQDTRISSLALVGIVILITIIVQVLSPTHQETPIEKIIYTLGMLVFIAGTCWRLKKRWDKQDNSGAVWIQFVGVTITALALISGIIWK